MASTISCCNCAALEDVKLLKKCPICFRYVCEECCYRFCGRWFCNKNCADYFFFGGEEDD